jgi:hypothetical protein
MAIPSRGIGWSTVDNLLWQISKQLEQLTNVTAKGCTTTTTTTTLPVYRVYTALLTQVGPDDKLSISGVDIVIGVTYEIYETAPTAEGYDFTNVGAPNNNIGTSFVATGTTPNSWGNNVGLKYNTGAPTVIVLENTIGNIYFGYTNVGRYSCSSDFLFIEDKTTISIDAFGQNANIPGVLIANTTVNAENTFEIRTDKSGPNDDILIKNRLEIRVYN